MCQGRACVAVRPCVFAQKEGRARAFFLFILFNIFSLKVCSFLRFPLIQQYHPYPTIILGSIFFYTSHVGSQDVRLDASNRTLRVAMAFPFARRTLQIPKLVVCIGRLSALPDGPASSFKNMSFRHVNVMHCVSSTNFTRCSAWRWEESGTNAAAAQWTKSTRRSARVGMSESRLESNRTTHDCGIWR